MRIAMIGFRGIPHTYGGGEEFVLNLAPRLVQRGHEVIVYCRSNLFEDKSEYYQGVRRIFLTTIEHKALGQFIHTSLSVIDVVFRSVDIIFVHTLPSGLHTLIPWFSGKKIVTNVDGLDWKRDKWGRVGKLYLKLSGRVVLLTSTEIVTDALGMREYYLRKFKRDSTFIPSGARIESSTNPQVLKQYGMQSRDYYLVACRLVPENNILLIIKAFEKLKTDKKLIIAGDTNYKSKYLQECKKTTDKRIVFLGHISDREHMKELYCHCYAYLHGHSLGGTNPALLQALGRSSCALALNVPFNHEVLLDCYGILFETDVDDLLEKMQFIEDNPNVAEMYRRRAAQRIREAYTWEHTADKYDRLFRRLATTL